jgi:integrase
VLVKSGISPKLEKVASKIRVQNTLLDIVRAEKKKQEDALTFADLFSAWLKDGVKRGDGNAYLIRSFNKYTDPAIGTVEVKNLTEHHLRDLYRSVIKLGKIPTAHKLATDIGQAMRWAEKRKPWRALLIDGNPAELVDVTIITPEDYDPIRSRLLSIGEIFQLKQIFDNTAATYADASNKYSVPRPLIAETQIALWLCLGTVCRIGELLMTRWEHVNFEGRTWFIPKKNTKDDVGDQLVYLSDFTLQQFQKLHALNGDKEFAFPARNKDGHVCLKSVSKQVGDRQAKFKSRTRKLQNRVENNSLVLGDTEWTPHDLRRTGATLMQKLKISRDVINLCQNHVIGTKVDRVYLLDDYADDKREAWNKLGDRLEAILSASNIVELKAA